MKFSLLLVLILVLSLVLRVWGLDRVPPELFGDELDVGYHAFSLLKTGRDYYGQVLPFYIHSFSEWRAPFLMYATAPFVGIFGLNEWGVRLPSAVFGSLSILFFYLLVVKTLKNKVVGLIAVAFLAISPWHLQYSRTAFEVSLLLVLILGGTLLFLQGLKDGKWLLGSSIVFALTFYTYNTVNLFTPLFVGLLVLTNVKEVKLLSPKYIVVSGALFIILILPIVYHTFFGFAAERFSKFSIFSDQQIVSDINLRRSDAGNGVLEKITHNKPLAWGKKIISNYTTAFSPQFLFINGDPGLRHAVQEVGELYWAELPFLILGLLWVVKRKEKQALFWLAWLLIAPLPAALTRDGAMHATRLILMLLPLTLLTAVGANEVFSNWISKTKKIVSIIAILILLVESSLYLHRYWVHYPVESWRWWSYGYKEAMLFMKERESNYEILVFNNTYEPAFIRFLFWWQYPPENFLREFQTDKAVANILPGFDGFDLKEKYYFGSLEQNTNMQEFVKPYMLYLVSQRDEVPGDWDWEKAPPAGLKILKTIRSPRGEPIFYVVGSL